MNKVPFPLAAFQERKEEALWAQTERWIIHGPSSGAPLCSFLLPRTYIWKETWSWGLSRRGASTPCLELVERCCPEGPKASEAMGPRLPTTGARVWPLQGWAGERNRTGREWRGRQSSLAHWSRTYRGQMTSAPSFRTCSHRRACGCVGGRAHHLH